MYIAVLLSITQDLPRTNFKTEVIESGKLGLVKVCPSPFCEAVWHNVPKKHTKCNDCGGNIMLINEDTFWKKFATNWFQYDFVTGEYYYPRKDI